MPTPTLLKVARTPTGYCLRVEGRGTMKESRSAAEFVIRSLETTPAPTIAVDLSACEHLDSTFLGCLVEMQRRAGKAAAATAIPALSSTGPRFVVSAPPEKVKKLLSPTRLDVVLKTTAEPVQLAGQWVELPAADPSSPDVIRHVMDCHRRLAELGGPQQAAFAAIADNIQRELQGKQERT